MKRRDWQDAIAKRDTEARCRVAENCDGPLEAAHIIGRARDTGHWVNPDSIVPLCKRHHMAYDAHTLDLMPYLTPVEQTQAVHDAGGIETARRRISGRLQVVA